LIRSEILGSPLAADEMIASPTIMRNEVADLPLVSVITPAYNAAPFIGEALQSALAQTYLNIEVIVVDDGSEDETRRIAEEFTRTDSRVSVLHQPNRGVASARNLAIEHSKGEFIAPLDADDIWYPEKLEKQMRHAISRDPTVGLVYGWYRQIDAEGAVVGNGGRWLAEGHVYNALVLRNFIGGGSMPLMTRACLDKVGGYSTELREHGGEGCEDWDLYLRIGEKYNFRVVPEYLAGYRRHSANMSLDRTSMARSQKMVIHGIEKRGTAVPSNVLRWARARQCLFELQTVYRRGDYGLALALARESFGLDPAGLLAFLYGKAQARIYEFPETVHDTPGLHAILLKPYEFLSLKRFHRLASNHDAPAQRSPIGGMDRKDS